MSPFANQQLVMYNVTSPQLTECIPGNQQNCIDSVNPIEEEFAIRNFQDQIWTPVLPANNAVMEVSVDKMTVEQTAGWVHMVAQSRGWAEAWQYSQSFLNNNIWGRQLENLTIETLKSDFGINKYGHRLELIEAIQSLFPGMQNHGKGEESKMM